MNKKWIVIGIVFVSIVFCIIIVISNKLYYPSLPIESITPKEAIQKLNESNQNLVMISKNNDVIWYITYDDRVNENIEHLLENHGWAFQKIEGNSLFFEKGNEIVTVGTQMWTTKYRLVKVPSHFRND